MFTKDGHMFLAPSGSASSAYHAALCAKPIVSLQLHSYSIRPLSRHRRQSRIAKLCLRCKRPPYQHSRGSRSVEDLQPGDLVLALDRGAQPLVWCGQRHFDAETLRQAPQMCPIVIRARALGDQMPTRDLRVAPAPDSHHLCAGGTSVGHVRSAGRRAPSGRPAGDSHCAGMPPDHLSPSSSGSSRGSLRARCSGRKPLSRSHRLPKSR